MNVTIYTPKEAVDVNFDPHNPGFEPTTDYGLANDEVVGMLPHLGIDGHVAIFVYESGRTFYYCQWGIDYEYIADLYEYIPSHNDFRRKLDLLIEQHRLNIITAIHENTTRIEDYLYDISLTDTTVLADGARLYEGMGNHAQ